jgi:D-tyrosyl-tRNA(Tyr) deacylase
VLFVESLRAMGLGVQTGVFGAHMLVDLRNDGPVTILLEQPEPERSSWNF